MFLLKLTLQGSRAVEMLEEAEDADPDVQLASGNLQQKASELEYPILIVHCLIINKINNKQS